MQFPKSTAPKISGKARVVQEYQGKGGAPKMPETSAPAKRSYYRGGTKPQSKDTPYDGFPENAK